MDEDKKINAAGGDNDDTMNNTNTGGGTDTGGTGNMNETGDDGFGSAGGEATDQGQGGKKKKKGGVDGTDTGMDDTIGTDDEDLGE